MVEFDKEFERQCEEYLAYLYEQAEHLCSDCTDLDMLVQDTLMALVVKLHKGEPVEHPKVFLVAVLKNKYNGWLREKYKKTVVEYCDETMQETHDVIEDREKEELQSEEPLSLIRSDLESNILILAYENPVSVRGIADTMGMPSAYIEQIIERLIEGELMGRTTGGLVYTRCFMQRYEDSSGDIPAQEKLAEKYAAQVWEIAWKQFEPLTKRTEFNEMTEKQKVTLLLFMMNQMLAETVFRCRPNLENQPKQLPERPNAGRWLASGIIFENGQGRDKLYDGSGPVYIGYSKENDGICNCQMLDCQSVFGDAHWAYRRLKYNCSLTSILRFCASFLPCDVKTDNNLLYELISEFEKLGILRRDADGEVRWGFGIVSLVLLSYVSAFLMSAFSLSGSTVSLR